MLLASCSALASQSRRICSFLPSLFPDASVISDRAVLPFLKRFSSNVALSLFDEELTFRLRPLGELLLIIGTAGVKLSPDMYRARVASFAPATNTSLLHRRWEWNPWWSSKGISATSCCLISWWSLGVTRLCKTQVAALTRAKDKCSPVSVGDKNERTNFYSCSHCLYPDFLFFFNTTETWRTAQTKNYEHYTFYKDR